MVTAGLIDMIRNNSPGFVRASCVDDGSELVEKPSKQGECELRRYLYGQV